MDTDISPWEILALAIKISARPPNTSSVPLIELGLLPVTSDRIAVAWRCRFGLCNSAPPNWLTPLVWLLLKISPGFCTSNSLKRLWDRPLPLGLVISITGTPLGAAMTLVSPAEGSTINSANAQDGKPASNNEAARGLREKSGAAEEGEAPEAWPGLRCARVVSATGIRKPRDLLNI